MTDGGRRSTLRAGIEFTTHNPDNLICIERQGDALLFRAAHHNFSARPKAFLIRQLAAEGYIPDHYEHLRGEAWPASLVWVLDRTLLRPGPEARRRVSRFMQRLLLGACVLWCLEVLLVLLAAH
jgi:hypothetical protein